MISLAFSPCPNDAFIFDAIVHNRIDLEGLAFDCRLADVEQLNQWALAGDVEVIKVSFHTYLSLRGLYTLLESGSALGYGNGPLLIAGKKIPKAEIPGKRIALPGEHTTAHLLFNRAFPGSTQKKFMVFSMIEEAVLSGEADAGVIIHENRFTFRQKGLVKIMDLGEYWEKLTGAPVPLGGIIARKSLGEEVIGKLNRVMRSSVGHALAHPEEAMKFVKQHAQEMDEEVMKKHIRLYVNKFTVNPGKEGWQAIQNLADFFDDNLA